MKNFFAHRGGGNQENHHSNMMMMNSDFNDECIPEERMKKISAVRKKFRQKIAALASVITQDSLDRHLSKLAKWKNQLRTNIIEKNHHLPN